MTKFFQVPILLDESTACKLDHHRTSHWARVRKLAKVLPFGMTQTVLVNELLPPAVEPCTMAERDRRDYEAALDAFLAGRWEDAADLLHRLPKDGPCAVLQAFMDKHGKQQPPDWDGVIVLEAK
jgi:adenylate cyclase